MNTCTAERHGDPTAYTWHGCRCPKAREAQRIYRKRLREGRQPSAFTDSTGTARRLQALAAIGYDWTTLAGRLTRSGRRVSELAHQRDPIVHVDTAARVQALFAELVDKPAPPGYAALRARNKAVRNGWVSPLAWDDIDDPNAQPNLGGRGGNDVDEVLIRRVYAGNATWDDLNAAERIEVIRRRGERNWCELGRLLDAHASTIWKYAERRGLAA